PLFTTTVAIAVSQFAGFAPTSQIVYVIVYVPLGVFGATVKFPSASIVNGPSVTGVTSVLVVLTRFPFKVSFVITLPPVEAVVSSLATIPLLTTTVAIAVSQFAGFAPTSQIVYVIVYVPLGVFGVTVK